MRRSAVNNTDFGVWYDLMPDGRLRLFFSGRLDSVNIGELWDAAGKIVVSERPAKLVVDAEGVDYCDVAGAGLFIWLRGEQEKRGGEFSIEGLAEEFSRLLKMVEPGEGASETGGGGSALRDAVETVGRSTVDLVCDLRSLVVFIGEVAAAFFMALIRPMRVRWKDAFFITEKMGADAFGIVGLIGFLIGLILAYESANSLEIFGAEIYVADFVAFSLFRELGPLMTAIILAGRSGSAFAAELGTMKVNEEIDALTTLGLDSVRFLVVTRVLAVVFVMPILTIFASLFGLVGGCVVMVSRGFTVAAYIHQIQGAVGTSDFVLGLVKAVVFGAVVSGVGCLRGLQTGAGARAVGVSATRAVVSGIVLIVIVDGIFAVACNALGI